MKILINLSTLKKGGGQNVGLNFIQSLTGLESEANYYFLVANGSDIHRYIDSKGLKILSVMPSNPVLRILKELFVVNFLLHSRKIALVYSYFGIGLFVKSVPQVSGSADSNIYYPEINFWSHYHGFARLKKYLVDRYRIWGICRAHAVIFENAEMEVRGKRLYGLTETAFIKPSINFRFESDKFELPFGKSVNCKVGLFLCGWQLNKNIMRIPDIAKAFKELGRDFRFVLTASDDGSEVCESFKRNIRERNVEDRVFIVGSVNKTKLKSLYDQVDFVFLLSLLESFSNNIIEAWHFDKPLVVSDEAWSRGICRKGAVYVQRDSVSEIVKRVESYIDDPDGLKKLLVEGKKELRTYPTVDERTVQEISFIKYVARKN